MFGVLNSRDILLKSMPVIDIDYRHAVDARLIGIWK